VAHFNLVLLLAYLHLAE